MTAAKIKYDVLNSGMSFASEQLTLAFRHLKAIMHIPHIVPFYKLGCKTLINIRLLDILWNNHDLFLSVSSFVASISKL